MKEKLTNNWLLKLISVCLAVAMWLIVCNKDNPLVNKTVTVRNVKYLNESVVVDSGKTYSVEALENKGIEIVVPVHKMEASKVKGDDFQIVVDLEKMGPYGSVKIEINWLNPGTYSIDPDAITLKTTEVEVTLENIIERSYPVQLHITGEPAEGYIMGEGRQVTPRTVKIKAPESVMEKIRSVGIEVDVSDQSSEVSGTARLVLYDVSGNELALDVSQYEDYAFSISDEEITYTIPLLKTKEVTLNFEGTVGEVAEGYRFTDIIGMNQTVYIAGLRAVLADVGAITVPAELLNLEGATGNVDVQIDLTALVPEGVTVESEDVVTITLVVEPLVTQTRHLMPEQIRIEGAKDGWSYTIRESVAVEVKGLEDDLNALTDEMLDAWISVGDLKEGTTTVPLHVTVDTGFTLVSVGEATVTMESVPVTESSDADESSSSGESDTRPGESDGQSSDSGEGTSPSGGSQPASSTASGESSSGRSGRDTSGSIGHNG